jgi:mitogen-activated protein kinase 1/3
LQSNSQLLHGASSPITSDDPYCPGDPKDAKEVTEGLNRLFGGLSKMGWSDVEDVDASKGIYVVCGQLWSVSPRYKLQAHVGSGSYGDVCRAVDLEFGQVVALKRVPDVFFCQLLAKRVLREVCIMRRLIYPYIISLTDVFTSKNLEKPDATDLYIATEFAECGDLYHQEEPMTAETVRTLIWQLLASVRYMHACHVWHRDIKSENVLLTGNLQAKLCDFGLSRSALEASSYMDAKPTTGRRKRPVLTRQYTKTVVTPSHRAPEVVMSQGQYTSAIDV